MKSRNKKAGEATKRQESVIAQSGSDLKKSLRFDKGDAKRIEEPVKVKIPGPFIGIVMH